MKTPIIDNDIFSIRKLLFIIGSICFIAGVVSVSLDWRNFGSLLILGAILAFGMLYWINDKYKEYKKVYFKYLPKEKALEMLHYGSFKFTNDCLIYSNKNILQEINWTEILSYNLIDSVHIILLGRNDKEHNFIISETEMDKSDFQKVLEFIKERVKKTTYNTVYN
ncbi:hypothetical protein KLA_16085 [Cellulophaga geojensis KL-A]|uniref:YcxB-like protein domain-containing protein n=1 Tax=Cellulophaga geojensis KL-A TaxID=1328323 RepID=A0ABP3B2T8_9FLAO|nr:hypothetical protein [Cellulophaga geojensis]EWH10944.1 hypothetical protein KLA_16085 [Cellulophaga geojensis KL-A]